MTSNPDRWTGPAAHEHPLLEVVDLTTEFVQGDRTYGAVNGISLTLDEGEILGIVGESGSGKSATALSLMRLLPPAGRITGGQVNLRGRDLVQLSEKDMQRVRGNEIGIVFQDPVSSLNPILTVGRQLVEALRKHQRLSRSTARARAAEMLDLVGMADPWRQLDSYPHHLSGGMRQRIAIALALSCEPKILIADESTTALDVTIQAQVLELIGRLGIELKMAVIVISHDLGVVAGLANRVCVMYGGNIVEAGSVEDIFYHPRHPYTRGLLASIPRLDTPRDQPLPAIKGTPSTQAGQLAGCAFQPRCPVAVERCVTHPPVLEPVSADHGAACWLAQDTAIETSAVR